MQLKEIREFFWPLLDPPNELKSRVPTKQVLIEDENLSQALALIKEVYNSEEERRKTTETKAGQLLSTISLASSLILAANTFVTAKGSLGTQSIIFICLSCIVVTYTIMTVWYSIKTLMRGVYRTLSFSDFNLAGNQVQFTKELIKKFELLTIQNEDTINGKVDSLSMAQEYYKRAIAVIMLCALTMVLFTFLKLF